MKGFLNKSSEADEKNYIIYKAENLLNAQVYIGATSNSIEKRKWDHLERAKRGETNKFHNSIRTYGEEAFEWVQLTTATDMDELAQLEKSYIKKYDSKENGLNSDIGAGFQKSVFQYSKQDGKLVAKFSCLREAADVIDTTKKSVSNACLNVNNEHRDYYWSYKCFKTFKPNNDKRCREVYKLTLDDVIIDTYKSVSQASALNNLSKTCIARVCRKERHSSGGFKWEYK